MQWLQDLNQSNVDNLNNVRSEASGHFNNKSKENLKAKFDELETHSKIKKKSQTFYGYINDFKKCYQPRTNIITHAKGDMVRLPQCVGRMKKPFLSAIECTWR
jgi:hypothetical protein